jgi:hypothetical protein
VNGPTLEVSGSVSINPDEGLTALRPAGENPATGQLRKRMGDGVLAKTLNHFGEMVNREIKAIN